MRVPAYIKPISTDTSVINGCQLKSQLVVEGNSHFHIFTHGIAETILGNLYLMPDDRNEDSYLKIVLHAIDTGNFYLVYDGRIHGYDNMFCNEHMEIDRDMEKFELNGSDIFSGNIILGYNIDYEDEKEDYDVDENEMVEVMNRDDKISWQQVKEEGYDYIHIDFTNEKGDKIEVDFELA